MATSTGTFDFDETKNQILKVLQKHKLFDKIKIYMNVIESEIRHIEETDEANR